MLWQRHPTWIPRYVLLRSNKLKGSKETLIFILQNILPSRIQVTKICQWMFREKYRRLLTEQTQIDYVGGTRSYWTGKPHGIPNPPRLPLYLPELARCAPFCDIKRLYKRAFTVHGLRSSQQITDNFFNHELIPLYNAHGLCFLLGTKWKCIVHKPQTIS